MTQVEGSGTGVAAISVSEPEVRPHPKTPLLERTWALVDNEPPV